jgi:Single-strand binding protein family
MSFSPRLRQSCRKGNRGADVALPTAGALQGQDPRLVLNRLFLSGVLAADPQRDEGRDGEPVTLLLVAFPAPDARDSSERVETASCEVEVPHPVAERYGRELRAGDAIFVTGQLSGGGGVVATEVHSGPAPGDHHGGL